MLYLVDWWELIMIDDEILFQWLVNFNLCVIRFVSNYNYYILSKMPLDNDYESMELSNNISICHCFTCSPKTNIEIFFMPCSNI